MSNAKIAQEILYLITGTPKDKLFNKICGLLDVSIPAETFVRQGDSSADVLLAEKTKVFVDTVIMDYGNIYENEFYEDEMRKNPLSKYVIDTMIDFIKEYTTSKTA